MVLADEVNRAPAKVQSALLEAMAERQVSVGSQTYPLPELFLVMATQNPIEQEGTYPLPEAQLDRFLMHVNVDYPDATAELEILRLTRAEASQNTALPPQPLRQESVFAARQEVLAMHMSNPVEQYIVQLVIASRKPGSYSQQLAGWIEYGGSPRATIALDRCSRAHAWLRGQDYVSPDDVQAVAADVLRHRLILSFEAEANGVTPDQVIRELLALVPVG
jgi:MoxR-like ATPase